MIQIKLPEDLLFTSYHIPITDNSGTVMSYCVISHNPDWCAVVVFRISVTYSAQTTDWVPCQTVGIRCFGAQLSVDRPFKKPYY